MMQPLVEPAGGCSKKKNKKKECSWITEVTLIHDNNTNFIIPMIIHDRVN